jgi:antitoxin (DNA-binding transcriptional repressor) of toxin-antitoxin stability system
MSYVNMFDAKSNLSRLVDTIESGQEQEIILARNGRPAARLVPLQKDKTHGPRLGIAKGKLTIPDDIDRLDAEVAALFRGEP